MQESLKKRHAWVTRLPRTITLLLENTLEFEGDRDHWLDVFKAWHDRAAFGKPNGNAAGDVPFYPSRILMQDTAGIAVLVDLASLRDVVAERGGDPKRINPKVRIDLVVDHSVNVDHYGSSSALSQNMALEQRRNKERYGFFKWAEESFDNLRVIPPGNGICHQINLEQLSEIACPSPIDPTRMIGQSVIGTDSHTTMVNALGILGWGVGGVEAELVAMGEPISITLPHVTELRLTGTRRAGVTATDIALHCTRLLRSLSVVGNFIEVTGPGLSSLDLADRAAIANMTPEFGATATLFPVDEATLNYLSLMGRSAEQIDNYTRYARDSHLWRDDAEDRLYTRSVVLDLSTVTPVMAGPSRPQDVVDLAEVSASLSKRFPQIEKSVVSDQIRDGAIAIAAITSCTNTANPRLMIAAGLVAEKAVALGLKTPAWVKTSLAPGSRVIGEMLDTLGLQQALSSLGFDIVGYGCATCVGNSGGLTAAAQTHLATHPDSVFCAVLSGNRNFESRIHPDVRANYLASPPLVVAAALTGNLRVNLETDPIASVGSRQIMLADLWPTEGEIEALYAMWQKSFDATRTGKAAWSESTTEPSVLYPWDPASTFIRKAPFFDTPAIAPENIRRAKALLVLGDSVTTDHISPISRISPTSIAGQYLLSQNVAAQDFGGYGDRRGNYEVMWRGGFAHPRLVNSLSTKTGSMTSVGLDEEMSVFDAAKYWTRQGRQCVVFAGREYGTGSARDWAAKATQLLGVSAVVANSFERIHRSNLIALGILPISVDAPVSTLEIDWRVDIDIVGVDAICEEYRAVQLILRRGDKELVLVGRCEIHTANELKWLRCGGAFQYAAELMSKQARRD